MDPTTAATGLAVAKIAVDFLKIIAKSPLEATGSIIADEIKFFRRKNQLKLARKTIKILEAEGIDPSSVLPSFFLPLMDAAGDAEDETLSDLFAGLLASGIDPATRDIAHPSFSKVLAQLSPLEAKLLCWRIGPGKLAYKDDDAPRLKESLPGLEGIPDRLIWLSVENLRRLGIAYGQLTVHPNGDSYFDFTDYGLAMMKACLRS